VADRTDRNNSGGEVWEKQTIQKGEEMNGKKEGTLTPEQLIEIRKIFKKTFGPSIDYQKCVRLPEDDTGGWAPNSILVVYKEYGVPDRYYYPQLAGKWGKMEEKISELLNRVVYFEEINGAVSALY
jgi:hypothetical protein